jgi:polyhydroxyalkanoate synthase subunit PhaC
VLSTSGHIAAMVNPPGNEKARYQVAKDTPEDPQGWLHHAENCHGTWWPDYASWLDERCGEEVAGPRGTRRWRAGADRRRAGDLRL